MVKKFVIHNLVGVDTNLDKLKFKDIVRVMPKRTYQPKKRHRAREHGFLKRMATKAGKNILRARRLKGRTRLTH